MNNSCLTNLLKYINLLQNNSNTNDCINNTNNSNSNYNTRVISLYKKNGTLFTTDYTSGSEILNSSLFRIMNINDTCCTLLILSNTSGTYQSTNQFITVNTNCLCAVRCIEDSYIKL